MHWRSLKLSKSNTKEEGQREAASCVRENKMGKETESERLLGKCKAVY